MKRETYTPGKTNRKSRFSASSVTMVVAFALVFAFNTFSQPDGIIAENAHVWNYSSYDMSAGINAYDLLADNKMVLSAEYKVDMSDDGTSYIMYETENSQTTSRTEYLGQLYAPVIGAVQLEDLQDKSMVFNRIASECRYKPVIHALSAALFYKLNPVLKCDLYSIYNTGKQNGFQNAWVDDRMTGSMIDNCTSAVKGNDNGDGDKKESRKEKKERKAKARLDAKYLERYSCIDDFQFDLFEQENPTNSFGTNFTPKKDYQKTSGQTTRKINAKYLLEHACIESFLADEYESK